MRIIKLIISCVGLILFMVSLNSCQREFPRVADNTTNVASMAAIQVFNATVNSKRNNIYVDGFAVNSTLLAFQGVAPNVTAAYAFLVQPGARTIQIKDTATVPATTQSNLTFTQNYGADTSYTIFTYDTITSIKQMTVINNIVVPTDSTCMLRFANFIYNPTAVPNVDVYSFKRNAPTFVAGLPVFTGATPVFSNIATNQVTGFIPFATGVVDTFYVYEKGTTSPLLAKGAVTVSAGTLVPQRSYTSVYNGSYKGTKAVTNFATN